MSSAPKILTINSGSSSLKFGLYASENGKQRPLFSGTAEGIGKDTGTLTIKDANGQQLFHRDQNFSDQSEALSQAVDELLRHGNTPPQAVGHRIVHGGPHLRQPQRITPQILQTLKSATHFAPLHIPASLDLIRAVETRYPPVPQFVCFDTAFHTTLPPEASTYAIPHSYREAGIQRYGFHGLSYESIVEALKPDLPQRLIVAHLGNGCSLCAIAGGHSVDTSMGLTPTGGIPMSTRIGDIDPGVPLLLMRGIPAQTQPIALDALEDLLNHQCGLQALSGGISDMRELSTASDAGNPGAALAITIFTREIAKTIASYISVLNGIDMLVFTGGIGEHSASIRARVCEHLLCFGLHLDTESNQKQSAHLISANNSSAKIAIIPAEEDAQIARHVSAMLEHPLHSATAQ